VQRWAFAQDDINKVVNTIEAYRRRKMNINGGNGDLNLSQSFGGLRIANPDSDVKSPSLSAPGPGWVPASFRLLAESVETPW